MNQLETWPNIEAYDVVMINKRSRFTHGLIALISGLTALGFLSATAIPSLAQSESSRITSLAEGADAAAPLFNPLNISRIDLEATTEVLNALNADTSHSVYQPGNVTLTSNGSTFGPLEMNFRLKGHIGSYRSLNGKAGFKIKLDFDTAHKSQRLLGLKKLTLNNMVQDPSMVHEVTAYKLFRAMGVPAPRVGYAEVYLNGESYGLYALIETIDSTMLSRWVNGTNHLYEGTLPNDLTKKFKLRVDMGNVSSTTDIQTVNAASLLTGQKWLDKMESLSDFDEVLNELATEMYLAHWDGYGGNLNNFFVHFDKSGKMRLLPWGADQALAINSKLYGEDSRATLVTHCRAHSVCKARLIDALYRVHLKAQEIQLQEFMESVHSFIEPAIAADNRKEFSLDESRSALARAQAIVESRATRLVNLAISQVHTPPSLTRDKAYRSVRLKWEPRTARLVSIVRFEIQISTDGKTWKTWKNTTNTGLFVTGIKAGKTRYFRIRTVTNFGNGSWSVATKLKF